MKLPALFLLLLLSAFPAAAQSITVEIEFDQEQFLANEDMIAKVRITNFSGHTLQLGTTPEWLTFSVQREGSHLIAASRHVPVEGAFELESSSVATRKVNLGPYYNFDVPGGYRISATVRIPGWPEILTSRPALIDIIRGNTIWQQEFGVPYVKDEQTGLPEVRQFALIQANYLKEVKLYLRISTADSSYVFKVLPLGPMVILSQPEPQMDKYSNLHLLYQVGPRTFLYTIVNPDGLLIARETYDTGRARPRLRLNDEGRIIVSGGVRRRTADDIPPYTPTVSNSPSPAQP